jgi:uncharacterized protein
MLNVWSKHSVHQSCDSPLGPARTTRSRRVVFSAAASGVIRRARGEAGPDSDIDLLVIVDDDTPAEKVTIMAGFEARRSYHGAADVIPVREAAFRRKSRIAGTLPRAATLGGIVVYERP